MMAKSARGVRNRATNGTGKKNSAVAKTKKSLDEGESRGTKRVRIFGSSNPSTGNGVARSIARSVGSGGGKSIGFMEFRDRKKALLKSLKDDVAVLDKQMQCDITGYSQYPVVVHKKCKDALARVRTMSSRLKEDGDRKEGGGNGRTSLKGIEALKMVKELEDEAEKVSLEFRNMVGSMESFANETCACTEHRVEEMIQCH